jgi:cell division protein FtsN
VNMQTVSAYRVCALVGGISLLLLSACAPREMAGTARKPAGSGEGAAVNRTVEASMDTVGTRGASYDLEDEMPEKSPQRPAQLIERLEPAKPDSISVTDIAVEETPKQRYDVGYRIQVFASGDRAAAEKVKERIVAETAMSAYIEYEDGLYKVRAGDFAERRDAAQARLKLAGAYPGSWIVRTTIRR